MTADKTKITPENLRQLLEAGSPHTRLVLTEGRLRIEPGSEDDLDTLVVITRGDLAARVGDQPDEAALSHEAASLNTELRLLGA
ncbi:hypothetical protein NDR87_31915 [Nocardia sp. CDC159]|uniref:Uncharacterized protein n=1 Tax=Nocardia pulmonis TaxID=2951408 RepID=A0A9X2EFT0_9NOCA|nr:MULTISPECIES: hypothetical protein [Nocardia]MCM6778098.1 hypothetical protein [Nocardia pulmonis]MCM6790987.1 hypothetical protein [Nocardia sp. CDC159]